MATKTAVATGLVALSIALIAACVVETATSRLAASNPEAALKWDSHNPNALAALATARFADPSRLDHDAEASRYATAALRAAPLNAPALRVLALEAERAGDTSRAGALMRIGDHRSRRDILTQLWLFGAAAQGDDFAGVAAHADVLLRQDWKLESILHPAMIVALRDPRAIAPFANRLGEKADWRGPFLRAVAFADPAVGARLFQALAAAGSPPTDAEASTLITRMVAQGDYRGARMEWARLLPRGAPAATGALYNGDFRAAPGAPPFNWRLTSAGGANAEYSPDESTGSVLHVVGPADRTAALADQLLTLAPGDYRLSGQARIEPGQSGDLFSWRLACAANAKAVLAQVNQTAGPPGWRAFAAAFTVPAAGCDAQWLELDGLAHDGFEPAEAWYRTLRVAPAPGA